MRFLADCNDSGKLAARHFRLISGTPLLKLAMAMMPCRRVSSMFLFAISQSG